MKYSGNLETINLRYTKRKINSEEKSGPTLLTLDSIRVPRVVSVQREISSHALIHYFVSV